MHTKAKQKGNGFAVTHAGQPHGLAARRSKGVKKQSKDTPAQQIGFTGLLHKHD